MDGIHLMPHQSEAIDKLKTGSILCGGVGTGKSITSLAYYYIKVCHGFLWADGSCGPMQDPRDLYIITTARKRDTKEWEEECKRFPANPEVHVTIDSWNNIHKYEQVNGAFFIFDEQRVVGSGAWVRSFLKIVKTNDWILLSATPGDSWMDYIPVFLANGFYKNRTQFLHRHAVYNRYCTKFPKIDRWVETGYLETLRRKITVTMKYDKKTVPHWENILVGYDKELYRKVAEDRWDYIKNEPIQDISRACQLMRRVSATSRVNILRDEGSEYEPDWTEWDIAERTAKIFSIWRRHERLIVFYNYDYELEDMLYGLTELKGFSDDFDYEIAQWNGHVHEPLPTGDSWIYLVQYNAGAEGWNCTKTDAIAFYSQSYSYKTMTQAAGRIDRLNTPYEDLYYYILKSDSPIDKAISRALKNKKTFNEKNWLTW